MDNWFLTELVVWRLAGAAVWQAAFFGAAFVAWAPGALLSECRKSAGCLTTYFLEFAFLYALQFGVLFAHRMNLSASEAMFTSPIPQIGLHGRSWPAAFLSRVLLRGRKVQDLIGVASLLGATSFTAMTWLITYTKLHSSTAPSMAFCSGLGVILGLVYTLQHFTRCVSGSGSLYEHSWLSCAYMLKRGTHAFFWFPSARVYHAAPHCPWRQVPRCAGLPSSAPPPLLPAAPACAPA